MFPGLDIARGGRRVLVVATELISRLTDWEDRNTCVLFGDGAGFHWAAALLRF